MLEQDYLRPKNLTEAIELKSIYGKDSRILAGGTDLIINLRDGVLKCKYLIDIKKIPEMQELGYSPDNGLSIGGAVSLNEIIGSKDICENYPILCQSAATLANSLLRNRATMVGNICNASPAGDMLPAVLVLNGSVEIVSKNGTRTVPLKDFFLGVKRTVLQDDEIVVRITFPPADGKGYYLKKSRIKGHDLAQIGVAGFISSEGKLSLSLGAVAPVPLIFENFEFMKSDEMRAEKIADDIISQISPISDQRASKEYRIAMARHLIIGVIQKFAEEV